MNKRPSLAERTKLLKKWIPHKKLWSKDIIWNNKNYIDIFCNTSPKSASTSLNNAFGRAGYSTIHVHSTSYLINDILKKNNNLPYFSFNIIDFIEFKKNNVPLIIDVYREPLGRKISSFFHLLNIYLYKNVGKIIGNEFKNINEFINYFINDVDKLINIFNNHFLFELENRNSFFEWRNDLFEINDFKFDKNKNHMLIFNKNKKYLLLRFSDINNWESIFKELGYDIEIKTDNTGNEKQLKNLYDKFKKNYYISDDLLNSLLYVENDTFDFFYTEQEKQKLIKKYYSKLNKNIKQDNLIYPNLILLKKKSSNNLVLRKIEVMNEISKFRKSYLKF